MIHGLQIEISQIGISAKVYDTSLTEFKVSLEKILYGHVIVSVVDVVIAKNGKGTFIIIADSEVSSAIEVDIVTCDGVHDKVQLYVVRYIYEERETHVASNFRQF